VNTIVDFKSVATRESEESLIEIKVSDDLHAYFSSKTGFLQKFKSQNKWIKARVKLIKYGTTTENDKSGAYLFLPDGPAVDVDATQLQWIRVEQDNSLRNRVCVNMTIVLHCVELYSSVTRANELSLPFFSIWNVVDLRKAYNYELAVHVESEIQNENSLFSDLNGFQYVKRKKHDKLHIQGNVYPMPSGAFIQDAKLRLSVLTAQPVGVASLEESCIQMFLDRRLDQDDNRGMEQPMNDNVVASSRFLIFFEKIQTPAAAANNDASAALTFPSIMSQILATDLLNPILKLILVNSKAGEAEGVVLESKKNFLNKNVPCDLHLVNMRSMQSAKKETLEAASNEVALILHRYVYDDCSNTQSATSSASIEPSNRIKAQCSSSTNKFTFQDMFTYLDASVLDGMQIKKAHLTLTLNENENDATIQKTDLIFQYNQPMQIEAFRVYFQ
jgi:alpha-mannosidase II